MTPRVSVVIPTYDRASVLPHAIGSVLDQTMPDFELLVIGDGCTDESGRVVESMADERISWFNLRANTGHQSGPNNEGLRRARADVIAYLGHDDLWLPHHLELLLGEIDDGARIAHGELLVVNPHHAPRRWPPAGWRLDPGTWVPPTTLVHERGLVDVVGGWRTPSETGYAESESEFLFRLAAAAGPPRRVRRLTAVKLPALRRRDVYRSRPSHEQGYWLERIRGAADPEASMVAACDERQIHAALTRRDASALHARRFGHTVATGFRSVRRRLHLPGPRRRTTEERWRAGRRFKGLEG